MNQTHVDETFLKLEEGLERTFNFHAASVRKKYKKKGWALKLLLHVVAKCFLKKTGRISFNETFRCILVSMRGFQPKNVKT